MRWLDFSEDGLGLDCLGLYSLHVPWRPGHADDTNLFRFPQPTPIPHSD
jgi:hypothetical protein